MREEGERKQAEALLVEHRGERRPGLRVRCGKVATAMGGSGGERARREER